MQLSWRLWCIFYSLHDIQLIMLSILRKQYDKCMLLILALFPGSFLAFQLCNVSHLKSWEEPGNEIVKVKCYS